MANVNAESYKQNHSYGKRPLWQWVLIYLVIGALIYGLIYVLVINKGALPFSFMGY